MTSQDEDQRKKQNQIVTTSIIETATEAETKLMVFLYNYLVLNKDKKKTNLVQYKDFVKKTRESGGTRNVVQFLNEISSLGSPLNMNEEEVAKLKKLLSDCKYPTKEEAKMKIADYKTDCKNHIHIIFKNMKENLVLLFEEKSKEEHGKKNKEASTFQKTIIGLIPTAFTNTSYSGQASLEDNAAIHFVKYLNEAIYHPDKLSKIYLTEASAFLNNAKAAFANHPKLVNDIECLEILKTGLDILSALEPKPQVKEQKKAIEDIIKEEINQPTAEEYNPFESGFAKEVARDKISLRGGPPVLPKDTNDSDIAAVNPVEEDEIWVDKTIHPEGIEKLDAETDDFLAALNFEETPEGHTPTVATSAPSQAPSKAKSEVSMPSPIAQEELQTSDQVLDLYRRHIVSNKETLLKNPENKLEKIVKAIDGFFSWVANKDVKFFSNALENSFFKPQSKHGKELVEHAKQSDFSLKK